MKVEKVHEGIRYTLSNEDLKNGDKVYPIANGRVLPDGGWILHGIDFRDFMSGFPDEPHTIEKILSTDHKPYEVHTDKGLGHVDTYYKIIKKEHQLLKTDGLFGRYQWTEILESEYNKLKNKLNTDK